MKVLFCNRRDAFSRPGGDTMQMVKTAEFLKKLNIQVDICLSVNSFDFKEYDLIHIFNTYRPFETFNFIRKAKDNNKKVALSSIYWDFSDFIKIHNFYYLKWKFEKTKDFYRIIRDNVSIDNSFFDFLMIDYRTFIKTNVDFILPNSLSEWHLFNIEFDKEFSGSIVYNAIDSNLFNLKNFKNKSRNEIFGIFRVDPRKNLLNLSLAVQEIQLLNYFNHYGNCSNLSIKNKALKITNKIIFHGPINNETLPSICRSYSVHVLPSYVETPGLVQLEAAACGCTLVSTSKGSTKEYLKDYAYYIDPMNTNSIKYGIETAIKNPVNPKIISSYILDNFTWDISAKQTLNAYELYG
jgi:glycosyltransferase involved in cell wall biosynthesis